MQSWITNFRKITISMRKQKSWMKKDKTYIQKNEKIENKQNKLEQETIQKSDEKPIVPTQGQNYSKVTLHTKTFLTIPIMWR
jgi:hypothetical protein